MRPTRFEIPVNDIEASKIVYTKVLGWKYEETSGTTFIKDDSGQFGHFWPAEPYLHH